MNVQVTSTKQVNQNHFLSFAKFFKKVHQVITGQEETILPTERQLFENEIERLRKELQLRHANFENAIGKEYIDIAIYELNLTQQKYEVTIRQLKKMLY